MDLKLITYPNKILETKIEKEWDFDNPPYDAVELKASMLKIMKDNLGIGLSTNQVGITDVRAFVFFNQQANNRESCETLCLHPKYVVTAANVVAETQPAALIAAKEIAKLDIAGSMQSTIAAIIETQVANQQFNTQEAASLQKSVAASKNIIAQNEINRRIK